MKYVYVLSSSEDDYYTEQALISIYSLRRYNPDAYVILFVDQVTIRTLENERSRIKEFVDEIITVSTPSELNFLQRSRYIKTSLRQLLTGDFLYLDTDTIILGNLKKLEGMKCEMGAVPLQDSDEWGLNNIHPQLRSYNNYRSLPENENHSIRKYYNGGVFLCRDTIKVHKFFETWHKGWLDTSAVDLQCRANQPCAQCWRFPVWVSVPLALPPALSPDLVNVRSWGRASSAVAVIV